MLKLLEECDAWTRRVCGGEDLRQRSGMCKGPVLDASQPTRRRKEEQSCWSPEDEGVNGGKESSQERGHAGPDRWRKIFSSSYENGKAQSI